MGIIRLTKGLLDKNICLFSLAKSDIVLNRTLPENTVECGSPDTDTRVNHLLRL
jgi:hypothetical protein